MLFHENVRISGMHLRISTTKIISICLYLKIAEILTNICIPLSSGIETLTTYKCKYGRNPLLELPLAINPSGAARSEPKPRGLSHFKRPHTQRTGAHRPAFTPTSITGEAACPYSKQFVHSKSSQYRKMKQEWRNNVYVAR